jgi:hypothetical protein
VIVVGCLLVDRLSNPEDDTMDDTIFDSAIATSLAISSSSCPGALLPVDRKGAMMDAKA